MEPDRRVLVRVLGRLRNDINYSARKNRVRDTNTTPRGFLSALVEGG